MKYISTRGNIKPISVMEAIKVGMVPQGGLFIPEDIPLISSQKLSSWINLSYAQLAQEIFSLFLADDFSEQEITEIIYKAYRAENFAREEITPLVRLDEQLFILELFHGPTGAFKDIALQALPHILSLILKKLSFKNRLLILTATSGDTGKAALEGFKNIPGIQIVVYYPFQKVSKMQEWQMLTTEGDNTQVIALQGNFDDCQNAVKQIFAKRDFNILLAEKGFELSSANSINWGRLFPQIVYYFYAYLSLLKEKHIQYGERINFAVPTGNFGNILAAWYAKEMGLPVAKLICASNINKVLTDFFNLGSYEINRPLLSTISPSMDILISSNLERFLFYLAEHQSSYIAKLMKELQERGRFVLEKSMREKIKEIIYAGYADEKETLNTIRSIYYDYHYLADPHTAVGIKVFRDYQKIDSRQTKTVVTATATPFKFNKAVLTALTGEVFQDKNDEFLLLEKLSEYTGLAIPALFQDWEEKTIKDPLICPKDGARRGLLQILKLNNFPE